MAAKSVVKRVLVKMFLLVFVNGRQEGREPVVIDLAVRIQEDDHFSTGSNCPIVPGADQTLAVRVSD